ncbi:MAG TPA: DUF4175 family protein, partial [Stellaceae bacterium]|nr:DUF4175 family protein [Stellaceae bacterium]
MSDSERSQQRVAAPPLGAQLRLAGAALLWERLWPSLWPAVGIAGAFLVLALFDLPARLPGVLHAALLVAVAGGLAATLVPALRGLRLPDRGAERRRMEQASGLTHRPLTALADRLSGGGDDPAA